ncbi:4,5:9,10-diseco-3-hydroxy-5,9,17-trioxoandrosta-1(10),2-diene-4-oate hydrolase [Pseudonocardia ammonioxydans]|uniref:4,5:9,10-diseco-3-hydroxy-5,9,17-trioxoandrosta-1(10),2-diene-4-oate hydrolase n=1 Tax=Pseudonocardia ammonioxydans TaxID=260086 RepID=A0A1I5FXG6_PSUAM|nr:alpha/beta fold hydrolase [Pseudonocardia ammonioxydans]SFO28484.1 4,5:9,10-diseco-3-hydroxy-5,9,17-trioxoandrosta-1(10),2-diene-4-oate hydrolase [Pseudonocardia ammonioxydans]
MTVVTDQSTGKFIQAGPYRIHYHDVGEGPAVIMLHGAGPGASAWSNFSGNVDAFAASHRTLLVDMLGFGKSDGITDDSEPVTTIRARALRDLLDALGIEKASFVGNSMGGTVAMAFAVDYPERTERLVLMGSGGMLKTLNVPQPSEGHRALRAAAANPTRETIQRLVDVMLYDSSVLPAETFEERLRASQERPTPSVAGSAYWRDQEPELHTIQAKTLIVWGREDRVNPLEIGLMLLREIPLSRLLVLKRCGHWAQVEQRDEFNRVALDFLNS